jgi:hypothetical protein
MVSTKILQSGKERQRTVEEHVTTKKSHSGIKCEGIYLILLSLKMKDGAGGVAQTVKMPAYQA